MAKELPWFKFEPSTWLSGEIAFEDMEVQGLFINICAAYWERSGEMKLSYVEKRWNKATALNSLLGRFISVNGDFINIKFLDIQLQKKERISMVNSGNGSKGGRPSNKHKKALGLNSLSEKKAKNAIREEKRREENNNIEYRKLAFAETLKPFVEKYGDKMIFGPTGFYSYWTEPNKSKTKFRMESEKTWDISRRLATWAENDKGFNKPNTSRSIPPGLA